MNDHVLGFAVAEFNTSITGAMLAAAEAEAGSLGAKILTVCKVPGAYELPLVVEELMRNPAITSVIVLGYIERGETQHGEVMAQTIGNSLLRSSLQHRKAIGFGIIGPGAVVAQAEVRKEAYARAAVRAAVASTNAVRSLQQL